MDDETCFHPNKNSIHSLNVVKVSQAKRNSNGTERGCASRGGSRAAKEVFEIDPSAIKGAGMGGTEERGMMQQERLDYRTKSAQMP